MVEFIDAGYALSSGQTIVRDIDLQIPAGETTVLLGRSGCGKTTLLRLVNALLLPSAGSVRVAGRSTHEWNPIELRRRTGYIMQEAGLLPHYTVEANIGLVPTLSGTGRAEVAARVREMLSLVQLEPDRYAARFPHELSGGERQRVGIARALAADPPLLLCDEPFAALDPLTRADLQRELLALQRHLGKTILFVTHDVREAMLLADQIVLMTEGRIAMAASPDDFVASDHPEAVAFARSLST